MINVIQYDNLSQYSELYIDQFRLRHQEFIDRQNYEVKSYKGMEFDEYDSPASVYLVYSGDSGRALGVSRLTPTIVSCMLYEQWPHLLSNPERIISPYTWEGTRFCIDSSLPSILRRQIAKEICFAYLEVGLQMGIKNIVGLMHTLVLKSLFGRCGLSYKAIGPISGIGEYQRLQASIMEVTYEQFEIIKMTTSLKTVIAPNTKFYNNGELKNAA